MALKSKLATTRLGAGGGGESDSEEDNDWESD